MTDHNLINMHENERKYLLDVIRCLRYLARHGIALQGNENNNFAQPMMVLGMKDEIVVAHRNGTIGNKFIWFYLICLFTGVVTLSITLTEKFHCHRDIIS